MTAPTDGRAPIRTALEEERDFLFRSLRDLDAERTAGDIDDEDYQSLRDDYTVRAAEVVRRLAAIDEAPVLDAVAVGADPPSDQGHGTRRTRRRHRLRFGAVGHGLWPHSRLAICRRRFLCRPCHRDGNILRCAAGAGSSLCCWRPPDHTGRHHDPFQKVDWELDANDAFPPAAEARAGLVSVEADELLELLELLIGILAEGPNGEYATIDAMDRAAKAIHMEWHEKQGRWVTTARTRPYQSALAATPPAPAVERVESMDGMKFFLKNPEAETKSRGAESWLLLRASGTEPLLRIYAESCSPGSVEKILNAGRDFALAGEEAPMKAAR